MNHPSPPPRRLEGPDDGTLEVFAADEQDAEPVDPGRWRDLAVHVLEDKGVRGDAELSLLFVDEGTMAGLNQRFMGEDGPTDVLAFPIDEGWSEPGRWPDAGTSGPDREPPDPREGPVLLGDVVICPSVARRNAAEHGATYEDELALLVVHGVLHVLGRDHADAGEAAAMQAEERDLLARFHRSGDPGAPG